MVEKNFDLPLLQRIGSSSDKMSPKQLILAKYVEKHCRDLVYATMTELAKAAGVSETTVVRFVSYLGYPGFPEFMTALRQEQQTPAKIGGSMDRFNIAHGKYKFPQDICKAIFNLEMQIMRDTISAIDSAKHQQAVDLMYSAPELFIVGCGANKCCAEAMGFAMEVIRKDVRIIENLDLNESSLIRSASKNSVAVVFTTPRYPSTALDITRTLKERGFKIVGITDSILSPIVTYCDLFFLVPEKYITFIDTNAAYMALIHSLVYAMHFKNKHQSKDNIEEYNEFASACGYYVNGQAELIDVDLRDL